MGDSELRVERTQLPAMSVVGYRMRFPAPEPGVENPVPAFWRRFQEEGLERRLPESVIPGLLLGVCRCAGAEGFDYWIAVPARAEVEPAAGQEKLEIPAARYIRCTLKGRPDRVVAEGFRLLHAEWLPAHDLVAAPGCELEWYDHRCTGGDDAEVDLFIPIL